MDERLTLGTEGYSPALLRKIEYAGGNEASFEVAAATLTQLAEVAISAKHVQRITERLGQERVAQREEAVAQRRAGTLKPLHAQAPAVAVIHVDAGKLQLRAEDGLNFPDFVGVARGDEQRLHAPRLAKIFSQASLT